MNIVSAGYSPFTGNDLDGHVHVHSLGNFLTCGKETQDRGFYCAAPLRVINGKFICDDPSEKVAEAIKFSLSYVFCHSIPHFDWLTTFCQGMIIGAYVEHSGLFFDKQADEITVEDCKNIVRELVKDISAFGFEK